MIPASGVWGGAMTTRVASTSPTKTVWKAEATLGERRTAAAISSARAQDFMDAPTEMASVHPSRTFGAPSGAESFLQCMGKPEGAEETGIRVTVNLLFIAALTQHRPVPPPQGHNS